MTVVDKAAPTATMSDSPVTITASLEQLQAELMWIYLQPYSSIVNYQRAYNQSTNGLSLTIAPCIILLSSINTKIKYIHRRAKDSRRISPLDTFRITFGSIKLVREKAPTI
ncbi:hypothetical protein LTR92_011345 [Exophiala xenobiotica]|nr:hypothetical protein LTR92_011345 [Exophiala xenobiotica]